MNSKYKVIKEEDWKLREDIDISDEFYNKILNNDIKLVETKGNSIKFVYVGVIVYSQEILIVLPKYYSKLFNTELECIVTLMKVLKKIPKSIIQTNKDFLFISRDIDNENVSEIAIADFILKDFMINEYYIKKYDINILNFGEDVDWNRTVEEIQPLISRGYPIYDNVYNKNIIESKYEDITKIHEYVVDYCITMYSELLDYKFDKVNFEDSWKSLNRIGSLKYILSVIQKELNDTYSDREVNLLKAIYNFFKPTKKDHDKKLSLYGTNNFKFIWEYVCGFIFGNEYDKLSEHIPIPIWKKDNGKEVENKRNKLEPDILRIYGETLMVLDGKYYSIQLTEDRVTGNPGTYDIVKQYTYELALKGKVFNKNVVNALLYPKQMSGLYEVFGAVKLEVFNMEPILNVYISPDTIWNMYIKSLKLNDDELECFINEGIEQRKKYFSD